MQKRTRRGSNPIPDTKAEMRCRDAWSRHWPRPSKARCQGASAPGASRRPRPRRVTERRGNDRCDFRPPLPSEGSRSSRPHPGPQRRGQQRSGPGCLCPGPGPQLRSHGNQAGPRCTPARPPAGACVRIQVSRIPAGDRSCKRTFPVAPTYVEKRVPGRVYALQFRAGTLQVQCGYGTAALQCARCSANPNASSCEPYTAPASSAWRPGAARSFCARAASASRWV